MDAPDFGSLPKLTITLEVADTPDRYCTEYVDQLYPVYSAHMGSLYPAYSKLGVGTSVAVLPPTYEQWFQELAKKRRYKIRRAQRAGYEFKQINRDDYLDDIHDVNTSLDERQGRPMASRYRRMVKPFGPLPDQPCPRHQLCTYGVLKDGKLVAYAWVYQTGEMFLLSTILGHGDHLAQGVMFLLIAGIIQDLIETAGAKYAVYERHWSGTDGLRFFKEQMGFRPYLVTFLRGDERPPTLGEKVAPLRWPWPSQGAGQTPQVDPKTQDKKCSDPHEVREQATLCPTCPYEAANAGAVRSRPLGAILRSAAQPDGERLYFLGPASAAFPGFRSFDVRAERCYTSAIELGRLAVPNSTSTSQSAPSEVRQRRSGGVDCGRAAPLLAAEGTRV